MAWAPAFFFSAIFYSKFRATSFFTGWARVWICRVLVTWGIISGCTAFVRTSWQFYTIRFLLGVAESGFFPGMILYLTYWFPSHRRAKMVAMLVAGVPVSGIIGSPMSGYILHRFDGRHHMMGWQWLFILEAIPAVILGFIILFCLDERVIHARWLTQEEKDIVAAEINEEAGVKTHNSILSVFVSPRIWLMCLIWFGIEMGSYAVGFWQPTIIGQTGVKNPFHIGLLTMVPYVLALISMIVVGRHSDQVRERRWHVAIPNIVAALGFVLCTRAGSHTFIAMIGLTLAVVGVVTALPMFWACQPLFSAARRQRPASRWSIAWATLVGFSAPQSSVF